MATGKISTPKWRSYDTVSFPFTPTHDGFLFVDVNPSSSSAPGVYYVIQGTSTPLLNIIARDGVRGTACAPVIAGQTYSNSYSSGVSAVTIRFYSF